MPELHNRRLRLGVESACLALLVVLTVWAGFAKLRDWNGPAFTLTNELYVPSAMFAAGRGFVNPPVDEIPGLRDFLYLRNGVTRFDTAQLPAQITEAPLDTYQRYHRYLVYAMGWVWRITGISWDSAKLLAVGQYLCCALMGYGLLRLFLTPWMALAGTLLFVLSPTVANVVFNIRDFSKAPFILGTILGLLYLLRTPREARTFTRVAVALGVVIGLGLGFRRDLLIAIPPVLLLLACAPMAGGGFAVRRRLTSALAFLTLVGLLGAPVFLAFQEKGSLVSHDILMGMSTELDDEMGLTRALYERVPVRHDAYVSGISSALGMRMEAAQAAAGDEISMVRGDAAKNVYLTQTILTFPADMVLRAETATLHVLNGVANFWPWPGKGWNDFIEHYGWLLALLCFTGAGMVQPLRAGLALLILLYFGGVTSLQYEFRHAFHLLFVAALCTLLPVDLLARAMWRGMKDMEWRQSLAADPAWRPLHLLQNLGRFLLGASAVTLLPWLLLLPWQLLNVESLRGKLEAAARVPVETQRVEVGEWTYFIPVLPPKAVVTQPEVEQSYWRPLYLMAELKPATQDLPVHIVTESERGMHDFSALVQSCPGRLPAGNPIHYYFQVPEQDSERNWVRFNGVGLPTAQASAFAGLYQVTEIAPLGTNPNFAATESAFWSRYFQRVRLPLGAWDRRWTAAPLPMARAHLHDAQRLIREGKLDEAQAMLDAEAAWPMFRLERQAAKAEILRLRGDDAGRERAILDGLAAFPLDTAMAYAYDVYLMEKGDERARLAAWQRAAAMAPENSIVRSRLKLETEKANAGKKVPE
jgi:hypothetical protein